MTHPDQTMDVELERLKPHPANPRRGDVRAIQASLTRFGQVKPIVVQRSTGYIVAGNHTYQAARALGWPTIRCLVRDMTDDEARGYLLADNRTADHATYDEGGLYQLLQDTLQDGSLEGTGYDLDDVETLADALGAGTVSGTTGDVIKTAPDFVPKTDDSDAPAPARKEAMRDIVLLMPASAAQEFGDDIRALQKVWGTTTVVDTVRQAVRGYAASVQ